MSVAAVAQAHGLPDKWSVNNLEQWWTEFQIALEWHVGGCIGLKHLDADSQRKKFRWDRSERLLAVTLILSSATTWFLSITGRTLIQKFSPGLKTSLNISDSSWASPEKCVFNPLFTASLKKKFHKVQGFPLKLMFCWTFYTFERDKSKSVEETTKQGYQHPLWCHK